MVQQPSPRLIQKIVSYMGRVPNPVYMGFIAVELGLSLGRTHEIVDRMEEDGLVHRVLSSDPGGSNLQPDAVAYSLLK